MENRGSSHGHGSHRSLSMSSDTESQYQSPLRSDSPFRSDDPDPLPPEKFLSLSKSTSKPIAAVDRFFSPLRSPSHYQNHNQNQNQNQKKNLDMNLDSPPAAKTPTSMVVFNKFVREEAAGVTKVGHAGGGEGSLEDGLGGERRSRAAMAGILRRSKREEMVERAELGFRVFEVVVCLISFSVMAADKTQGWSGDSFDRYKEYRYCVAVNVIGFVYAGLQACDLAYHLATGKHAVFHPLRCHFDFAMDQILAYLLISASSSAATRVDDWVSNWGKDEFTEMASASISMSFLAFVTFSLSALISGYKLCNRSTTTT